MQTENMFVFTFTQKRASEPPSYFFWHLPKKTNQSGLCILQKYGNMWQLYIFPSPHKHTDAVWKSNYGHTHTHTRHDNILKKQTLPCRQSHEKPRMRIHWKWGLEERVYRPYWAITSSTAPLAPVNTPTRLRGPLPLHHRMWHLTAH